MSARELTRVEVLSRVQAGTLSLGSAATLLAVSMDAAGTVNAQTRPPRLAKRADAFRTATTGHHQGDISISLRMGTFLFRVDILTMFGLTLDGLEGSIRIWGGLV